ncbi:ubiquitin-specific protease 12 [Actinidia rufa]|uniref:Ubiquitin-specific protease 12 n=1 Tax=Actinidia rufa TaxID=165716 RepID=A0A7J0DZG6_9ERIC|nr:ubiquitin-specific protease 12 [Actinidia rufa]
MRIDVQPKVSWYQSQVGSWKPNLTTGDLRRRPPILRRPSIWYYQPLNLRCPPATLDLVLLDSESQILLRFDWPRLSDLVFDWRGFVLSSLRFGLTEFDEASMTSTKLWPSSCDCEICYCPGPSGISGSSECDLLLFVYFCYCSGSVPLFNSIELFWKQGDSTQASSMTTTLSAASVAKEDLIYLDPFPSDVPTEEYSSTLDIADIPLPATSSEVSNCPPPPTTSSLPSLIPPAPLVYSRRRAAFSIPSSSFVDPLSGSGNPDPPASRYPTRSRHPQVKGKLHFATIRPQASQLFNVRESDWGFTSFMPLGELYDPSRGYLVNDTIVVEADVAVRKVIDYWSHDSKKETGYVGLKNQGATCYMNSLLQTLYHIPYFRKAVYHMPTTENDMPSGSIPLALQSLFYKLQYNDTSVATKELTKSFGWDTYDSFIGCCIDCGLLAQGTVVEGTIQQLFEGHHMNYIECINVDYKSTRKESFYDLQLDVKGCRDVYASFDKNVEEARKGVLFIDFPPVLQLQLKRFEYDFMRDTMVKVSIKKSVLPS